MREFKGDNLFEKVDEKVKIEEENERSYQDKGMEKINVFSAIAEDFKKFLNERNDGVDDKLKMEETECDLCKNKEDGMRREKQVESELEEKYPPKEGYLVEAEVYLRDENGKIVKDPETGEARRIDFVVVKDGKVIDSIEVTSKTADKTAQSGKENRIRNAGGNYIKDGNGNLIEIPKNVQTRIERRD